MSFIFINNSGDFITTEAPRKRKRRTTTIKLNDNESPINILGDDDDYPFDDDDMSAISDDILDDLDYPGDADLPEEYPGDDVTDDIEYPGDEDIPEEYPGDTNEDDYPGDDTINNDTDDNYPGDIPDDITYPGDDDAEYPGDEPEDVYPGDDTTEPDYPGDDETSDAYPGDEPETDTYPGDDVTADAYPGDDTTGDMAYPGDDTTTDTQYPGDDTTTGDPNAMTMPDATYPGTDTTTPAPTPDAGGYPGTDTTGGAVDTTDYTANAGYPGADPNAAAPATPATPDVGGYPGTDTTGGAASAPAPDPNAGAVDPGAVDNTDYSDGADAGMQDADMAGDPNQQPQQQGPGIGYDSMRNYNLYKEYYKLLEAIDIYVDKINCMTIDDVETNKLIKFCVNKLGETRELCYNYMVIRFDSSSYEQNRVFYQTLIVSIQLIFDVFAKVRQNMVAMQKKDTSI